MQINGKVLQVRPSSFASRDGKSMINMVYVDVYDKTVKLCNCETKLLGFELVEDMRITADVIRMKAMKFGSGISLVLDKVQEWDAAGKLIPHPEPVAVGVPGAPVVPAAVVAPAFVAPEHVGASRNK